MRAASCASCCDRPERRNACTIEMYHGIKKAAVLAERDPDVDVLVLTGAGEWFCVGGEMGGKHEGGQLLDRETDGIDLTPFVQLERCPEARADRHQRHVHGRRAGDDAHERSVGGLRPGDLPGARAAPRRRRLLPGRAAGQSGRHGAGEVVAVHRPADLGGGSSGHGTRDPRRARTTSSTPRSQETIGWVRQTGPRARTSLKRDLNRQLPPLDFPMFVESLGSEEVREGFRAFVEKRPPGWVR